jgi:hypothetical protein
VARRKKKVSEWEEKVRQVWANYSFEGKITDLDYLLTRLAMWGHVRSTKRGEAFAVAYAAHLLGAKTELVKRGRRYHVYLSRSGREKLQKAMGERGLTQLRDLLRRAYFAYLEWEQAKKWQGVSLADYFNSLAIV